MEETNLNFRRLLAAERPRFVRLHCAETQSQNQAFVHRRNIIFINEFNSLINTNILCLIQLISVTDDD